MPEIFNSIETYIVSVMLARLVPSPSSVSITNIIAFEMETNEGEIEGVDLFNHSKAVGFLV